MKKQPWKLSPSDFAFLWEECERCFYLKVVKNFRRPGMPFPRIFSTIDVAMKNCFTGRQTTTIISNLPPGSMDFGDRWVKSTPVHLSKHIGSCYIQGKIDSVIKCDDGSYAVIDFKTSSISPAHAAKYSRQLHAYAYALENAAEGKLTLSPVSRLGLIVFEPDSYSEQAKGRANLSGNMTWIEIVKDNRTFKRFLGEILDVLSLPSPPTASTTCNWCSYRDASRQSGF